MTKTYDKGLVYIVMPTYNRADILIRSVQSVIDQDYENWKLCIVDDNSTDNTQEVIERLEKQDSRIFSVNNTDYSHCCAGARLAGLSFRVGEFVAFLDSDDQWPEYHLSEFVDYLLSNEAIDIVFGDIQRINSMGDVVVNSKFKDESGLPESFDIAWNGDFGRICDEEFLEKSIMYRFNTGMHAAVYRSIVFDRVELKDVYGVEDVLFTLECISCGFKFSVTRKIHLYYLVHSGNVSAVSDDIDFEHRKRICDAEILLLSEYIPNSIDLDDRCLLVLKKRLSKYYVWDVGNNLYRKFGFKVKALVYIIKGITLDPLNFKYIKTFFGTLVR